MTEFAMSGLATLSLFYLVSDCVLALLAGTRVRLWYKSITMFLIFHATTSPLAGSLVYLSDRANGLAESDALFVYVLVYLITPPVAAGLGIFFGRLMLPASKEEYYR